MKLVFMPTADADLESIGDWIAEDSPARALAFVKELRLVCGVLTELPRGFPLVPRYELRGVRRLCHGNYLIFYLVKDDRVEILHVLNGAREYEPLLFPKG